MSNPIRRIRITNHAARRLSERDITLVQIQTIVDNPIETVLDVETGNYKSYGMAIEPHFLNETYLMVVHSKFNTEVSIISAMWQTTGGLRNNGFSQV